MPKPPATIFKIASSGISSIVRNSEIEIITHNYKLRIYIRDSLIFTITELEAPKVTTYPSTIIHPVRCAIKEFKEKINKYVTYDLYIQAQERLIEGL